MIIKMGTVATQDASAVLNFLDNSSDNTYLSFFTCGLLRHEVVAGKRLGITIHCERHDDFKDKISGKTLAFFMKYEDFKNAYERAVSQNSGINLYCIELDNGTLEPSILFEDMADAMSADDLCYDAVVR